MLDIRCCAKSRAERVMSTAVDCSSAPRCTTYRSEASDFVQRFRVCEVPPFFNSTNFHFTTNLFYPLKPSISRAGLGWSEEEIIDFFP